MKILYNNLKLENSENNVQNKKITPVQINQKQIIKFKYQTIKI